jgi:hypothetical protein
MQSFDTLLEKASTTLKSNLSSRAMSFGRVVPSGEQLSEQLLHMVFRAVLESRQEGRAEGGCTYGQVKEFALADPSVDVIEVRPYATFLYESFTIRKPNFCYTVTCHEKDTWIVSPRERNGYFHAGKPDPCTLAPEELMGLLDGFDAEASRLKDCGESLHYGILAEIRAEEIERTVQRAREGLPPVPKKEISPFNFNMRIHHIH